jgi:hypothetical protein
VREGARLDTVPRVSRQNTEGRPSGRPSAYLTVHLLPVEPREKSSGSSERVLFAALSQGDPLRMFLAPVAADEAEDTGHMTRIRRQLLFGDADFGVTFRTNHTHLICSWYWNEIVVRDPWASRHADTATQACACPGSTGRTEPCPLRRRQKAVNRHMDRIVGETRVMRQEREGRGR